MNVNAIRSLSPSYFLPINKTTAAGAGTSSAAAGTASSVQQQADTLGLSPAAKFLSRLQQLQAQNPLQFQAVLSQLTNQLEQAAAGASSNGNTAQANQLTQLAHSFQAAGSGGALPGVQQLQQAGLTGQHHHTGGPYGAYSSAAETQSQSLAAKLFGSVL